VSATEPKLTAKRIAVLAILTSHTDDCPLTGAEIGAKRFRHGRHGLREWANDALKALHKLGYAEPLGVAMNGARCWQATDLGKAVFVRPSTREAGMTGALRGGEDDFDPLDDGDCWNCGGEGYVSSCFESFACLDPDSGCDLCTKRCTICRPLTAPERQNLDSLRQVLSEALAANETPAASSAGSACQCEDAGQDAGLAPAAAAKAGPASDLPRKLADATQKSPHKEHDR
jgi:hypothetical protein